MANFGYRVSAKGRSCLALQGQVKLVCVICYLGICMCHCPVMYTTDTAQVDDVLDNMHCRKAHMVMMPKHACRCVHMYVGTYQLFSVLRKGFQPSMHVVHSLQHTARSRERHSDCASQPTSRESRQFNTKVFPLHMVTLLCKEIPSRLLSKLPVSELQNKCYDSKLIQKSSATETSPLHVHTPCWPREHSKLTNNNRQTMRRKPERQKALQALVKTGS